MKIDYVEIQIMWQTKDRGLQYRNRLLLIIINQMNVVNFDA